MPASVRSRCSSGWRWGSTNRSLRKNRCAGNIRTPGTPRAGSLSSAQGLGDCLRRCDASNSAANRSSWNAARMRRRVASILHPSCGTGRWTRNRTYCFGEGGAGTFSDGKLYTRATKRGPVREVYETLVAHGAPEEILIDSHPHIGSNLLPNVVKALRESIRGAGGEVHFGAKVTDLLVSSGRGPRCGLGGWARDFGGCGDPGDGPFRAGYLPDARGPGHSPGAKGVRNGRANRTSPIPH